MATVPLGILPRATRPPRRPQIVTCSHNKLSGDMGELLILPAAGMSSPRPDAEGRGLALNAALVNEPIQEGAR